VIYSSKQGSVRTRCGIRGQEPYGFCRGASAWQIDLCANMHDMCYHA
jgi:hypothetical protein